MAGYDLTFDGDGIAITDIGSSSDFTDKLVITSSGKVLAFGQYYVSGGESRVVITRYNENGSLDINFGKAGILDTGLGSAGFGLREALVTPDDRIIVSGYSNSDKKNYVVRYLADGQIDTSFASNGKYTLNGTVLGNIHSSFRTNPTTKTNDILIQQSDNDYFDERLFEVTLLSENGSLKSLPIGSSIGLNRVVFNLLALNDLVSDASTVNQNDPAVQEIFKIFGKTFIDQLHSEYTKAISEKSFNPNGVNPQNNVFIQDVNFLSRNDGSLIINTAVVKNGGIDNLFSHFTSDGKLDTTFGVNGLLRLDTNSTNIILAPENIYELVRDESLYLIEYNSLTKDFFLVRYTSDWKLDTTFGINGKAILPRLNNSIVIDNYNSIGISSFSVNIDSQKRILVSVLGAKVFGGTEALIHNTRLSNSGEVDINFGENGTLDLPILGTNEPATFVLGLDGSLFTGSSFKGDISISKYNISSDSTPIIDQVHNILEVEDDRIFQISDTQVNKHLQFQVSSHNQNSFNETLMFKVDDKLGTINGIKPGEAKYLENALSYSQVISSIIPTKYLPQGFDGKTVRELNINNGDIVRFGVINNGTVDQLRQDSTLLNKLTLSEPATLKVNETNDGNIVLDWQAPINFSLPGTFINNSILPLGTNTQNNSQGELYDFRQSTSNISATFSIYREATYNNNVYIYAIQDETGSILDTITQKVLKPTDAGYLQAALRSAVTDVNLNTANQTTTTINATLTKGTLFAPVIVINGDKNALLDNNPNNDPAAFTPFILGNSDKIDHIRLLGDNTFGFEDLVGGGDLDYNDIIVKATFKPIS